MTTGFGEYAHAKRFEFWDRLRHDYEGIPLQLGFEFGLERGAGAPRRP